MQVQENKVKTPPTPNEEQQKAIDTYKREGTFLVLAGPGTGKTFTVSQRIKAMIVSGVKQDEILCLTFSDAAAKEMRKKLETALNTAEVSVNIYTFHSFCLNLIQDNPDKFDLKENFNIITDSLSRAIIKECIDDEKLNPQIKAYRDDKNNAYKFIPEIKDCIEEIKKYRIKKEKFFENLKYNAFWLPRLTALTEEKEEKISKNKKFSDAKEKEIEDLNTKINKMKELWLIYELYQEKTKERHLIDFNDMIDFVLTKFETDKAFLSQIANSFKYIMVDEYQDTNASQNSVVIHLTKAQTHKNVFVVGDDDQIIYTFQGADLNTINNFKKEFPNTETICLNKNMRSTQEILDFSDEIIRHPDNSGRLAKNKLISKNNDYEHIKNDIKVLSFSKLEHEYNYIVDEIDRIINSDKCPVDKKTKEKKLSEIAILVRSNNEINEIADLLKNRGVQVQTSCSKDIFEIRSSIGLLLYMQFLVNPYKYENKFFELLLTAPFYIHPKDYEKLNKMKTNYSVLFDKKMLYDIEQKSNEFKDYKKIEKLVKNFNELKQILNKESIKDTVLTIAAKSGIFAEYINGNSKTPENIEGLLKLVEEAESFSMIEQQSDFIHFVEYLNRACNDGIKISTNKPDVIYNAVQVITLHSSKGREFEYVYMPSVTRGKCESNSQSNIPKIPVDAAYSNETYEEMDARYKSNKLSEVVRLLYVGITRAKHTLTVSYTKVSDWHTDPSKYIEKYIQAQEYDDLKCKQDLLIKVDYDYKQELKSLIDDYIDNTKFSVSSLNTYNSCPRQFLYSNILNLKVRDNNQDNLNLGNAVHKAYQDTVKLALDNNGDYPSEDVFQLLFENEMKNRLFSDRSIQKNFFVTWALNRKNAYKHLIKYPALDYEKPEYEFTQEIEGQEFKCIIDRIPCINGEYYIHDYKTGKRPENIEKLKKDRPNYYNQLALYKYALEKHENIKIKDCILIYPFDDNIELQLHLDDKSCNDVVNMYLETIKKIRDHEFPAKPSNAFSGCNYCSYKEICNYYGGSQS